MKVENRVITFADGRELKLPIGLTYDMGEIALCVNCGGVVTECEPLIRRSKYRNRAFEIDFGATNGQCLKCAQVSMTNVVARWFEAATSAVKTFNDLDGAAEKDEDAERMLDFYEQSIDAMQLFIERLGQFVGGADNHQVEYAHEPQPVSEENANVEDTQEG